MTSPHTNGPWGSHDYDDLLKQADARTTPGFGTPPPPISPRPPSDHVARRSSSTEAPASPTRVSRRSRPAATALGSPTRGQGLSWLSLLLVLLASTALGSAIYAAFAAVDVQSLQRSFRLASHDLNLALLSLVGALVALLLAVVATFRARPKLVATCAALLGVVLPFVAVAVGGKLGVDALASAAAGQLGTDSLSLVNQLLSYLGVDPAPFQGVLRRLFG